MDLQRLSNAAYNRVSGYLASEENLKTVVAGSSVGILSYGCVTILTKASFALLAAASWTFVGVVCAVAAKYLYEAATRDSSTPTTPTNSLMRPIQPSPTIPTTIRSPIPRVVGSLTGSLTPVISPPTTQPSPTTSSTGNIVTVRAQETRTPSVLATVTEGITTSTPPASTTPHLSVKNAKTIADGTSLWDGLIAEKVNADELKNFESGLEDLYSKNGQPLYSITNRIIEGYSFETVYNVPKWTDMVVDFATSKDSDDKSAIECWEYCSNHHEDFGEFILEEKLKSRENRNNRYPQDFILYEIRGVPSANLAIKGRDLPVFHDRIKFFTNHIATLLKG
ncbi:hypothetical protein COB11_03645 [Candidatus Aerophobetes bacterium]|uniref:Uncharacterized protein n=1 Tax=Aerophobetes bacterium TaxID=2030807 RepID=A0A2A4YJ90_UNCAE|nr:MAG: hypothetical protein COB11_03645 [Candidatus Aerophobetes bacterium]